MSFCLGCLCNLKDGTSTVYSFSTEHVGLHKDYEDVFPDVLDMSWYGDEPLILSLDLSTKSIGVALADFGMNALSVFTLIKVRGQSTEDFLRSVGKFIKDLTYKKNLVTYALENVPFSKNKTVVRALSEVRASMKTVLDMCVDTVPDEKVFDIYPQSWKSSVMDKSKGTGRTTNKIEIASDICDKYRCLDEYFDRLASLSSSYVHDYDGFDAIGILYHVRYKLFNDEMLLVNNNSLTGVQWGRVSVLAYYGPNTEDVFAQVYADVMGVVGADLRSIREWNSDVTFVQNLIYASNSKKLCVMSVTDRQYMLDHCMRFGVTYSKSNILVLFVSSTSKIMSESIGGTLASMSEHLTYYIIG